MWHSVEAIDLSNRIITFYNIVHITVMVGWHIFGDYYHSETYHKFSFETQPFAFVSVPLMKTGFWQRFWRKILSKQKVWLTMHKRNANNRTTPHKKVFIFFTGRYLARREREDTQQLFLVIFTQAKRVPNRTLADNLSAVRTPSKNAFLP